MFKETINIEGLAETAEKESTPAYPIYDDVPHPEIRAERFESLESPELLEEIDGFMQKIKELCESDSSLGTIVFLDKSARPLGHMVKNLFRNYVPDGNTPMPEIIFMNIGQEGRHKNHPKGLSMSNPVSFSGDVDNIRKTYKTWVRTDASILVVDEYSSTGASLAQAAETVSAAFPSSEVIPLVAFNNKVPKWYGRPDILGVREMYPLDYEKEARRVVDREEGVSYLHIDKNPIGEFPENTVPHDTQVKYINTEGDLLHRDGGDWIGDVPYAAINVTSKSKLFRKELDTMCEQIVKNRNK